MNKDELIEKLVRDLAVTQLLLARRIIKEISTAKNPSVATIGRRWQKNAQYYLLTDWSIGADAIETFMYTLSSSKASEIQEFLCPRKEKYMIAHDMRSHIIDFEGQSAFASREFLRDKYIPMIQKTDTDGVELNTSNAIIKP